MTKASLPPPSRLASLVDDGHPVACPQQKHVPLVSLGQEVVLGLHDDQVDVQDVKALTE